ncbi:hypothetical protein DSM107010_34980 [Chroococcidiopsis cubana SAG 39.79]|uniref:Protein kinase domain-containing protein n=1 Tax=Chroococcidiopsis cubana SAG 39.79 TaxID=388085 RepID=A0AB37UIL4_9CYAN|nr:hypothetical protein DSM107010_34980 [Chroococcidiopsis cubana SAG 39.79]
MRAALNSEHIVKILDFDTTSEGFPFYVMEYLKGESLEQLLQQQQRLTVEHTVEIVRQVCAGLQLAHTGVMLGGNQVRIVHGNLLPDNVFLVPTTSGESIKILDFGIAKKIRDIFSEYKDRIVTDILPGTFRYAAPEQIVVLPEIDGRADIYSLGIIFYRMLSGTDPFSPGSQARQVWDDTWAKAHTSQPPQPLRSQPGCEQISPQLEAVVHKCLQKSPEARFTTMAQLKQALETAIAQRPTDFTSTSSSNTIVQSPPPTTNSDSPTIFRQVIPLAEPGGVDTTIAQVSTESAPSSPDRTIYQGAVSPRSDRPNQTIYQGTVSPRSDRPNQTIYQSVASPGRERPNQTIYQGVSSSTQSNADRTIYQRQRLLLRLGRIPRQIWRATLSTTFSLSRIVKGLVHRIELWIRRHRPRF